MTPSPRAIARRGEDLPGNLIIGEESHARWLAMRRGASVIPGTERLARYAQLARETLEGRAAGSSAAGEQPKFTAEVGESADKLRHVLVKFTPPLDTAAGRRWCDLLLAEHLAAEVLRRNGHAAVQSEFLSDGRRGYLEVARFDRIGSAGRIGLVSLGALDDEFVGERRSWARSAAALLRERIIDAEDARELRWLASFGTLIANTDMHLGNASFLHDGARRLRLAPIYDMLPMFYAPIRDEIRERTFSLPEPPAGAADQWLSALPVAIEYWRTVSLESRLSEEFRAMARANAAALSA